MVRFEHKKALGVTDDKLDQYYRNNRYGAQPKYDGIRYIAHVHATHVEIYSRLQKTVEGKKLDEYVRKDQQLKHIAAELICKVPPGTVLDAEVVLPRPNEHQSKSYKVQRYTGCAPEEAWRRMEEENCWVEFAVFDILAWQGEDLRAKSQEDRYERLKFVLDSRQFTFCFRAPMAYGYGEKRGMLDDTIARGGEGLILKDLDAPYDPKRNKAWIKDKPMRSYDVVFMGITEAKEESTKVDGTISETKYKGLAGAIRFGQYVRTDHQTTELIEIGQTSGFDDATRIDVTENADEYTKRQRVFEVQAQGRQEGRYTLRHPQFKGWRDDKHSSVCVYQEGEA